MERSSSKTTPRRAWLLALLLLVAVCSVRVATRTRGEDAPPAFGGPTHPPTAPAPDPSPGDPATPGPQLASASLHVWVRALHRARYVHSVSPIPFAMAWPASDDDWDLTRLASSATADALRALSGDGYGYDFGRAAADLLPVAREEGFLGEGTDPSTPEAALVSIYAAWTEATVDQRSSFDAFIAANLEAHETWESISPEARRELRERTDFPLEQLERLRSVADETLARWPDHPVADHARFALVRAEMPRYEGKVWRAAEIAHQIDAIHDPNVREHAAIYVTEGGSFFESVDPVLLDTLARVPIRSPQNELRLATWGTNRAVFLEDWDRVRVWSARLRAALDAECSVEDPHHSLQCDEREYELRDVSARLVALGLAEPATWQEALTAEAWRCHLSVGPHRGVSRTIATWSGTAWSFEAWDRRTGTADCLDDLRTSEVVPDVPTRVRLTLEGG